MVNSIEEVLAQKTVDLFLKPSVDSSSGVGVLKFERKGDEYVNNKTHQKLTLDFLRSYGHHFILQEAVEQHPYLSQFCHSSINTLRVATYRSVIDETPYVIGSTIRIGHEGEVVDNAHAGGRFAAINKINGELGKCVLDQYGTRYDEWNEINYKKNVFQIPQWDIVLNCAKEVSSMLHHMRLVQLDIAIDKDCSPKIIEYNVVGYAPWLYMTSGSIPFGDLTSEIIDYCR